MIELILATAPVVGSLVGWVLSAGNNGLSMVTHFKSLMSETDLRPLVVMSESKAVQKDMKTVYTVIAAATPIAQEIAKKQQRRYFLFSGLGVAVLAALWYFVLAPALLVLMANIELVVIFTVAVVLGVASLGIGFGSARINRNLIDKLIERLSKKEISPIESLDALMRDERIQRFQRFHTTELQRELPTTRVRAYV